MTYELVKSLKDAGFPQIKYDQWGRNNCFSHYLGDNTEIHGTDWNEWGGLTESDILIPTLSELIEACGDGIFNLLRQSEWHARTTDKWQAALARPDLVRGLTVSELSRVQTMAYGKTSEEAVAKLWLALNKKP